VRTLYARHFASRRMLLPLYAQEYLGNLMYLAFHQAAPPRFSLDELGIPEYEFDGSLPDYDVERGVHAGYQASDQLAKDRWLVKPLDDCLNLKGLASTVAILKKERSPVLLLILPVNRRFYAFNGLDMAEFERRYQALRGAIRRFEEPGHIFVVDFYEAPWLKLGFADRMHADANGFPHVRALPGCGPRVLRESLGGRRIARPLTFCPRNDLLPLRSPPSCPGSRTVGECGGEPRNTSSRSPREGRPASERPAAARGHVRPLHR
jgi:DltD protein